MPRLNTDNKYAAKRARAAERVRRARESLEQRKQAAVADAKTAAFKAKARRVAGTKRAAKKRRIAEAKRAAQERRAQEQAQRCTLAKAPRIARHLRAMVMKREREARELERIFGRPHNADDPQAFRAVPLDDPGVELWPCDRALEILDYLDSGAESAFVRRLVRREENG